MRENIIKNNKVLLLFIVSLFGICCLFLLNNVIVNYISKKTKEINYEQLKSYTKRHDLSENYAILVDFSAPSGMHRFYVCDLQNHSIIATSHCAHGARQGSTKTTPVFSNEVGSNCSSIGHYKIVGKHKMSQSGLPSFKLVGLDESNSNAKRRGILIHSAKLISIFRLGIHPFRLPMDKRISSGCFAVDIDMMEFLGNLVDKEQKPILIYAYN